MAIATPILPSEYLSTSYRPDQELLDGKLVERSVGEYEHSNLQGGAGGLDEVAPARMGYTCSPGAADRFPSRFGVPDVSVISRRQEIEAVFTRPPLIRAFEGRYPAEPSGSCR